MKKITLIFLSLFFITAFSYGQNLVENADFENGSPGDPVPSWGGFKNRIAIDDITNSQVGQIENGDGSLFQEFAVTPGEQYYVTINYRWLGSGGAANSNLTVRIKDASNLPFNLSLIDGTIDDGFQLDSALDIWNTAEFSFVPPAGITEVRLLMFKPNGNKPLNVDDISVSTTLSTSSLEKFDFNFYPNPTRSQVNLSANQAIDKIEIYNLVGKLIKVQIINSNNAQVSIDELAQGVYLLKTHIGSTIGTAKLVKQ